MSQAPHPPETPPPPTRAAPLRKSNGCAVAGLVLGIVSIVTSILWFVAIPAAIAGLILSIIGVVRARAAGKGMGMGVAGIILSALGMVAVPVALAVVIWFWRDMSQWVNQSYQGIRSGTATSAPANNLLPLWWWLTGL
jgi:hypothetical protein